MLARLVLTTVVLGAVSLPVAELVAADNKRRNIRPRGLRSLFTKFARKKLELQGRLRAESMRPLVGVSVYADASRCSLALPLGANRLREACDDLRVVTSSDQHGRYRVPLRVSGNHRYLHVRFSIRERDAQAAVVIPLSSVDHILGKIPAWSYYRLDRDAQLALLRTPRDLVYARRRVAVHSSQAQLHKSRHLIARALLRSLPHGDRHGEREVITVSSCGRDRLYRQDDEQLPRQVLDFRFLLPAAGLDTPYFTEGNDCVPDREPSDRATI